MRVEVFIRSEDGDDAVTRRALELQTRQPDAVRSIDTHATPTEITGDVLAFLNSDDTPSAGWLAELLSGFDKPFVGVVGGTVVRPEETPEFDGGVRHRNGQYDLTVGPPWTAYQFPGSDPHAVVSSANCCVRAELLPHFGNARGDAFGKGCAAVIDRGWWVEFRRRAVVVKATTTHVPAVEIPTVRHEEPLRLGLVGGAEILDPLARGLAEAGHEVHRVRINGKRDVRFDGRVWHHCVVGNPEPASAAEAVVTAVQLHVGVRALHEAAPFRGTVVTAEHNFGVYCLGDPRLSPALLLTDEPDMSDPPTAELNAVTFRSGRKIITPSRELAESWERDCGGCRGATTVTVLPFGIAGSALAGMAEGVADLFREV